MGLTGEQRLPVPQGDQRSQNLPLPLQPAAAWVKIKASKTKEGRKL
jgi:hypothetical protein